MQALLGETKKQSFRFGILKVNKLPKEVYELLGEGDDNEVYFPPSSSKIATFDAGNKCFGVQRLIPLLHIQRGRIISDKEKGGLSAEEQATYSSHSFETIKSKVILETPLEDDAFRKELLSGDYTKGMFNLDSSACVSH